MVGYLSYLSSWYDDNYGSLKCCFSDQNCVNIRDRREKNTTLTTKYECEFQTTCSDGKAIGTQASFIG